MDMLQQRLRFTAGTGTYLFLFYFFASVQVLLSAGSRPALISLEMAAKERGKALSQRCAEADD